MSQEPVKISSFQEIRADLIKQHQEKKDIWTLAVDACDGSADSVKQTLVLMDDMDAVEAEIHELECRHIEKTVVPHLKPLILKHEREFQLTLKQKHEAGWAEIEALRKNGAPFKKIDEEVKKRRLDGITGLLREREITLNDIILRPVSFWLSPVIDYDKMKELGIEDYVRQNSYLIYELREQV